MLKQIKNIACNLFRRFLRSRGKLQICKDRKTGEIVFVLKLMSTEIIDSKYYICPLTVTKQYQYVREYVNFNEKFPTIVIYRYFRKREQIALPRNAFKRKFITIFS